MMESTKSVIELIRKASQSFLSIKKVYVFGSHARNTASNVSDYDIGVEWKQMKGELWGAFAQALRESNPTLNSLDIVRMDECSDELKERILSEGRAIYERKG